MDPKVGKKKKVVVNGYEFFLEVPEEADVEVEFNPLMPLALSNTEGINNFGNIVTPVSGAYLLHSYDFSAIPETVRQINGIDVPARLNSNVYKLVITRPELVRKRLTDFTPLVQEHFRLAAVARIYGHENMTLAWDIRLAENLESLTLKEGWTSQKLIESVVLHRIGENTYTRGAANRILFVQPSKWPRAHHLPNIYN